jgi:hypothetical protein
MDPTDLSIDEIIVLIEGYNKRLEELEKRYFEVPEVSKFLSI